jgi:hypothetical protein
MVHSNPRATPIGGVPALSGHEVFEEFRRAVHAFRGGESHRLSLVGARLLMQAAAAHDAGAFEASTLASRAAVEASCYEFLTRKAWKGGFKIALPRDLAGSFRRVEFDEVRRGVVSREVISPPLVQALIRIQESGNFSAHLAARVDKAKEEHRRKYGRKPHGGIFEGVKPPETRTTEEQSLENLRDTSALIFELYRATKPSSTRRSRASHSSPPEKARIKTDHRERVIRGR